MGVMEAAGTVGYKLDCTGVLRAWGWPGSTHLPINHHISCSLGFPSPGPFPASPLPVPPPQAQALLGPQLCCRLHMAPGLCIFRWLMNLPVWLGQAKAQDKGNEGKKMGRVQPNWPNFGYLLSHHREPRLKMRVKNIQLQASRRLLPT